MWGKGVSRQVSLGGAKAGAAFACRSFCSLRPSIGWQLSHALSRGDGLGRVGKGWEGLGRVGKGWEGLAWVGTGWEGV